MKVEQMMAHLLEETRNNQAEIKAMEHKMDAYQAKIVASKEQMIPKKDVTAWKK
jgi:outer membrane protein TolC